jgi:sugar lactone lactonase YvrE
MEKPSKLVEGRGLVESARWHAGQFWFADWNSGEILSLDASGALRIAARVPSLPLSFAFLPEGDMLIVSAADGRLLRRMPDGTLALYAQLPVMAGARWNEIVIDGRGNCYLNGPSLVLVDRDRKVTTVAQDFAFPNGMAINAGNDLLVVAESHGHRLTAFDIGGDGGLSNRRAWAELGSGTPDGIAFDAEGCVWYADVPNRCCARVQQGGTVLETIVFDRAAFACALGGADRRTLHVATAEWNGMDKIAQMTGSGQILSTRVAVAGAGWP